MPVALTPTIRIDEGGFQLQSPVETSQGFLRTDGWVSRPGVYEYPDKTFPDGIRRELRPPEEVFHVDSLKSYEGAPLTDGHPREQKVTSANVRQLEVGTCMGPGVRVDGDRVAAPMLWKDSTTIQKIRRGKRQLSPGYKIDLEDTSGIHPKYGRYDVVQRNIRVNHLALVDHARGGDKMQIRMDGVDAEICVGVLRNDNKTATRGITMDEAEQIRSLKAQLAEAVSKLSERQDSVDEAIARADRAEAATAPLQGRIFELEAQIAAGATIVETEEVSRQRTRADEAEAAVRRFDDRFERGVKSRANLMHRAGVVMGPEFRMDDLTERQIHQSVVTKLDPSTDTKGMTDAFLAGTFETLLGLHQRTARSMTRISEDLVRRDQADHKSTVDQKADRLRDFRNQWRKPLPNDIRATRGGEGR